MNWQNDAACKGMNPDLFYPDRGDNGCVTAAKAVCETCPVQRQCLEHALDLGDKYGIWGGMTYTERRPLQPTWERRMICPACLKEFRAVKRRTYCSRACSSRTHNDSRPAKLPTQTCVVCGAAYSGRQATCSGWCGAVARHWERWGA